MYDPHQSGSQVTNQHVMRGFGNRLMESHIGIDAVREIILFVTGFQRGIDHIEPADVSIGGAISGQ